MRRTRANAYAQRLALDREIPNVHCNTWRAHWDRRTLSGSVNRR
jgi:hypothetical protein